MQDNVICCPHCNGTGELRLEWYVIYRYQDCSDWHGPYGSLAEAETRADEGRRKSRDGVFGAMIEVFEKIIPAPPAKEVSPRCLRQPSGNNR
jgi:hypothetical protein